MYMFDGTIILYFFHMHDRNFMALLIVYITCTSTEAFGLSSHPNMHDIYYASSFNLMVVQADEMPS
jgi:hypothetical protein